MQGYTSWVPSMHPEHRVPNLIVVSSLTRLRLEERRVIAEKPTQQIFEDLL